MKHRYGGQLTEEHLFPCVVLPYSNSPLLYEDGYLRRSVRVWLRDNVGARAMEWPEFVDPCCSWIVLQGLDQILPEADIPKLDSLEYEAWRLHHMRLYFYFKHANMATLFKLTWGGA